MSMHSLCNPICNAYRCIFLYYFFKIKFCYFPPSLNTEVLKIFYFFHPHPIPHAIKKSSRLIKRDDFLSLYLTLSGILHSAFCILHFFQFSAFRFQFSVSSARHPVERVLESGSNRLKMGITAIFHKKVTVRTSLFLV